MRPAVVCVGVRCGNEMGTLMTAGIAMCGQQFCVWSEVW